MQTRKLELAIGSVLRYGVLVCAFVAAVGMLLSFSLGVTDRGAFSPALIQGLIHGESSVGLEIPRRLGELLTGLGQLNPDAILALGVLLLIMLPLLRVALTVVLFLVERDWAYVGITVLVFGLLVFGLSAGMVLG